MLGPRRAHHKLHIVTQDVKITAIKSTKHHMIITDITEMTNIYSVPAALKNVLK